MTREEILSHVDHTLLKPEATWPLAESELLMNSSRYLL